MEEGFKYFAFISYSHKDQKIAKKLKKFLEKYHLPSALQKSYPALPENLSPVFIDETNLVAKGSLSESLKEYLNESNYLIVICSPNSAKSEYVNEEIAYFIEIGKRNYIIPLIIDGEPHAKDSSLECFPPALLALPREHELLGIDLKKHSEHNAFLRVVATMLNLDMDDFISRDAKERRRKTVTFVSTLAVCLIVDGGLMLYGQDESGIFYKLLTSGNPLFISLFWLMHLAAFYATATLLHVRFGNNFLRWIRIKASKISEVNLIFGVNQDTVAFGRNISGEKGILIVYVDSVIDEKYEASIRNFGGVAYSDKEALNASPSFLRNIRVKPRKTKLRLYAISDEYDRNIQYARMMSESLEKMGITPEQTELVLLGTDEWKGMLFQASSEMYGYGSVVAFNDFEPSARLLIHQYPLCNAINFDENGRATEDIKVLIIGFGQIGREVLSKVIANGQFEGSKFRATIFDPFSEPMIIPIFTSQHPNMFLNYDISFEDKINHLRRFLRENASRLKYIVVCLEDEKKARDLAVQIVDYLHAERHPMNVYACDSKSVRCYSANIKECRTHWIYDSILLYSGELDKYAIEINHRYALGSSPIEDWKNCDYFGKMSARSSIDYLVPLVHRINLGALTTEQRETLAKNEHLRWCAFHYTFGFDVMDKEEFIRRIKARQDEINKYGTSSIRVAVDREKKEHVCLVDWDELDELSQIINSLTNGNIDYKEFDRQNVDVVVKLMQG